MVSSYQRSRSRARGSSNSSPGEPSPTPAVPSTSSGVSNSPQAMTSSNRLCAQCRNHGLRVPVRGHKRYCAYRLCTCRECRLVRERQRVVALHLYVRRAQEQEEEAAAAEAARVQQTSVQTSDTPASTSRDEPPAAATSEISRTADIAIAADTRERMLYESLMQLRQLYPVPEASLPLLLCILKSSRSIDEASAKIVQGTHELSTRGFPGIESFNRPPLYM